MDLWKIFKTISVQKVRTNIRKYYIFLNSQEKCIIIMKYKQMANVQKFL